MYECVAQLTISCYLFFHIHCIPVNRQMNHLKNYSMLVGRMHACQIGPTDTAPFCPESPHWASVGTSGIRKLLGLLLYPYKNSYGKLLTYIHLPMQTKIQVTILYMSYKVIFTLSFKMAYVTFLETKTNSVNIQNLSKEGKMTRVLTKQSTAPDWESSLKLF